VLSFHQQLGLLASLQILRDLCAASRYWLPGRDGFSGARCWSGGSGSIALLLLHRWEAAGLDPRQHGTSPDRRDTTICVLLRATCLFIDSYSLVGDGAFLDLAMMEAQSFFQFQRASRRRWSWAAADGFGSCRKP
jgi:hypothetical protein